jgi:HlyD family secretion protein
MNRLNEAFLKSAAEQSAPPTIGRWRRIAWLALALALGLALAMAAWRLLVPSVPLLTVATSELVRTVVASGRVQTPLRVDIGTQVTGTVAAIPVAEGQAVSRGQLLIALDDREARAAVAQARATLAQAQARQRQVRELGLPVALQGLRQAEVNLKNAQRQQERSRQLFERGFMGQSQLDEAQRSLELAQSQLQNAQLQVQSNGAGGSDALMAQAAAEQAAAGLRQALARLDYLAVRAPLDGTLITRAIERGDVAQPGRALMVLSPAGPTQLVVQIDERHLGELGIGQPALSSPDAYPDQRFPAQLAYINPAVDPQRGSVEVKFDVPAPPANLRQDMTVSVDIEVARHPGAIVVPLDAVQDSAGGAPRVMVWRDGRVERRAVSLGLREGNRVEVTKGLQAGERIAAAGVAGLHDGQRVRAATETGARP